ncbi:hypothetical protein [Paludisphaera rhizosphaerae]|uniref:hypothetical protein n=1 Tax=Paludisphaera rhizosphaerae TaxID=2711216 RepID=UPI0013ECB0D0|nr:hypothetical protein [Paludisphaera rhizosphaerae]
MRLHKLLPLAVIAVGLSGCGGSPEVGDAVVVPPAGKEAPAPAPAPTPSNSPETPADKVDPAVQPGEAPKTAPAPEATAKPE